VDGTAELMMTYVETGVAFTNEFGDINEAFYSSVESVLYELDALLRREATELYPAFRDRLAKARSDTRHIGWGFHDVITDVVENLEADLGDG
jgi:hypothetical protein